MAATNYTPIQLYRTTTASAVPSAGNLAAGELAINLTDEKLYFKNAGGTVTLLASSASASNVGTVTSVAASGGTTGLTFSGSPITSSGTLTLGGTLAVANGGTGATTLTSGYLVKGNGTSAASASVVYDDGTNIGLGVTPSAWDSGYKALQLSTQTAVTGNADFSFLATNWRDFSGDKYIANGYATAYRQNAGTHAWFTAPSGTAGNALSFTQAMTLDASGNLGVGGTPSTKLDVAATGGMMRIGGASGNNLIQAYSSTLGLGLWAGGSPRIYSTGAIVFSINGTIGTSAPTGYTDAMLLSTAGYLEATYSDKVVALGNSGTATTIDLTQGNVFTATLTGNCTFTLSGANANSSRGSSFTLILTNDGTAGRTVAWAGGNFRFPGGAASLSRTTTANATDIWVFFTPDNGTTWYGNISMKDMKA